VSWEKAATALKLSAFHHRVCHAEAVKSASAFLVNGEKNACVSELVGTNIKDGVSRIIAIAIAAAITIVDPREHQQAAAVERWNHPATAVVGAVAVTTEGRPPQELPTAGGSEQQLRQAGGHTLWQRRARRRRGRGGRTARNAC
jgi:hypothetical protein